MNNLPTNSNPYPPDVAAQKEAIETIIAEMKVDEKKLRDLQFPHSDYYFHFFFEKLGGTSKSSALSKLGSTILWLLTIISSLIIALFILLNLNDYTFPLAFATAVIVWLLIDPRNGKAFLPYFLASPLIKSSVSLEKKVDRSKFWSTLTEVYSSSGIIKVMRWFFPGLVILLPTFIKDYQLADRLTQFTIAFLFFFYPVGIIFVRFREKMINWRLQHILISASPEAKESLSYLSAKLLEYRDKVRPMITTIYQKGYDIDWHNEP